MTSNILKNGNSTNSNSTNSTFVDPALYNKTCYGCIRRNFFYCDSDDVCRNDTLNCKGNLFSNNSGCPVEK